MKIIAQHDSEGNIGIGEGGQGGMIAMVTGTDFVGLDEPCGAGMTSKEIAFRIVTCWNLHDGVPTEDIARILKSKN